MRTPCTTKELGIFYGLRSSFNYLASADESVSPDAWNIEIARLIRNLYFFFFFLSPPRSSIEREIFLTTE